MENNTLKIILNEYEQKRIQAELIAKEKKEKLYSQIPELYELDLKLKKLAIDTTKLIIENNDKKLLDYLNEQISQIKNKKNNILKTNNISDNYLEPIYSCKKCNDTGYFSEGNDTKMCNCLKQKIFDIEYNKSNIFSLKNQNFDLFNNKYYSDEIDKNKYNSDFSPRQNIEIIKSICQNFIKNFDNPDEKNLLFTGNTGLGKTFLSSCIANEMLKKGKSVLYQTAPVMLDSIIDYRFGKKTDLDIYKNILDVDLLIIDDLGTECINNMKFTELFNIINTRLLNQNNKITKTIISTNLNIKNLFDTYDERIVSRLVGHYNICRFFGDDIRFVKK